LQTYSLFELNEYVRRILALNLPDAIWVTCEIAQLNESRGNYFLELVQKSEEEDTIIARSEAAIWSKTYRQLKRSVGKKLADILQEGLEVKMQVRVTFHERYGLKMAIEDIDPTYTLGRLALKREQTLQQLEQEGKLFQNAELALPIVLQRIAILSSPTAAGLQDFQNQLRQNAYSYHYQLDLFPTVMQGDRVSEEMQKQLRKIAKQTYAYDVVVVIRGGGARLDLQAFNEYQLCAALADCPLPVLTGIGHDIDQTVADIVAHQSLKTPTAVADFLLQHNAQFEAVLLQYSQQLGQISQAFLQQATSSLDQQQQFIQLQAQSLLQQQTQQLDFLATQLPTSAQRQVMQETEKIDQLSRMTDLLSLEATLGRGYSLTTKDGKAIQARSDLQVDDEIETTFKDGQIKSKITARS